jgi:hypothetical protein
VSYCSIMIKLNLFSVLAPRWLHPTLVKFRALFIPTIWLRHCVFPICTKVFSADSMFPTDREIPICPFGSNFRPLWITASQLISSNVVCLILRIIHWVSKMESEKAKLTVMINDLWMRLWCLHAHLGRALTQAVSRCLLTAQSPVQS